jgi:hypothetical protein
MQGLRPAGPRSSRYLSEAQPVPIPGLEHWLPRGRAPDNGGCRPGTRAGRLVAAPPRVKDRTIAAVHARTSHWADAARESPRSGRGSCSQRHAVDRRTATGWPVLSCFGCGGAGGSQGRRSRAGQPPDEGRRLEPLRRAPVRVSMCRTRRQRALMGANSCGRDTWAYQVF